MRAFSLDSKAELATKGEQGVRNMKVHRELTTSKNFVDLFSKVWYKRRTRAKG